MTKRNILTLGGMCCVLVALAACGGTRDFIRSKDFRDHSPAYRPTGTPSPIANVPDMPGWTTDIDSAIAFATENPQNTVLFVQRSGTPQTAQLKKILNSAEAEKALTGKQQVTLNMATSRDAIARYGVTQAPAVVLIGPGGIPQSQKVGDISKSELLSYIR